MMMIHRHGSCVMHFFFFALCLLAHCRCSPCPAGVLIIYAILIYYMVIIIYAYHYVRWPVSCAS
jgi:hypothetical protein